MHTMTMHLVSPEFAGVIDEEAFKSLVLDSAHPDDHIEHIHVQLAADGGVDVVLFMSTADLTIAHINGAALGLRLLRDRLPAWSLRRVWLESV
jgi:hypothetical protein